MAIADAYVAIKPDMRGIHKETKKGLKGVEGEFDATGKRGGGRLSSAFGSVAKAGVVAAGAAAAAAMGTALVKGFGRLVAIDDAEAKLRGLGHSAESVEKIMGNALASVKGTAFGLDEAATVAAGLVASGIKPGQELENTLKTVADSATIAGIDMSEMGVIFGKVAAAGKLQGDELNQLAERGVPALQLLSEHLGVSVEETRKMVSAGEVSFQDFAAAMDAGMGGAALKSGETFTGAWKNVGAALGRIGATLLQPFFEAAKGGMGGLTAILDSLNDALQPVMKSFGEWLNSIDWGAVGKQMGEVFAPLWQALQPLIPALMQAWQNLSPIGILFKALAPVAAQLGGAIGTLAATLAGALGQALAFLMPVISQLATVVAGVLAEAFRAVVPIISMLAQMLGPILSVVLLALAPIITVVVQVVGTLLQALSPILGIIGNLITALLPPLMRLFMALAPVIQLVGTIVAFLAKVVGTILVAAIKLLMPIINVLITVLSVVLVAAINIVIGIINSLVWVVRKVLGPAFTWLYNNIINPVWNAIVAVIRWAWNNIIKPIWDLIAWYINNILAPVFRFLLTVVTAVWSLIRAAISAAWNWIEAKVFQPIVNWINHWLVPRFQHLQAVVESVWAQIRSSINSVWQFIKSKVFEPLANAVKRTLPDAFESGKNAIGKAWDGLKEIAKKPVKFVIETVLNKGLISGFNKIAGHFPGTKEIPHINLPRGFRTGGKVWGAGTETSDSIPAMLSHNEHVLTARDVRNLGGHAGVYRLRDMASRGLLPSFAGGGTLMDAADWWIAKGARASRHSRFNGGRRITSGHSRNSYHYKDLAVDFNYGPGGQNATEMSFFDRHIGEFQRLFSGIRTIWRAPGHYNHLHIDTSKGANMGTAGGGGGFDLLAPFQELFGKLTGGLKGTGTFGDMVGAAGKKLIQMPIDWITSKLGEIVEGAGDIIDSAQARTIKELVRPIAAGYGWGFGPEWNALDWLVSKESSWNPNAANPRSAARGLFQKMTSLHGPVEKTVVGQARWGLKYIKDTYGTPSAAKRHHMRENWYADGGEVLPVRKYDTGGILPPGLTTVLNATGRNEYAFRPDQIKAIAGSARAGLHVENLYAQDMGDAVRKLRVHEARREVLFAGVS